jgi:hypothetical protein
MAYAPPTSNGYLQWREVGEGDGDWKLVNPSPNHLDLLPEDLPIELRICGIPVEFEGDTIQVKVSNEDWIYTSARMLVVTDGCTGPFTWPDPGNPDDYDICVTNVVQYRKITENTGYHTGSVHVVSGIIGGSKPAHLHVIPEFAFGTAMAVLSLFSGLGIYSKYRKI